MAELIITDEERATYTYLEWDDAAIGRGVKKLAMTVQDAKGDKAIEWYAATLCLIAMAHETNAESSEYTINGVTMDNGETQIGDWKVTIQRTDSETTEPIGEHG